MEFKQVVSLEQAQAEVERMLDIKRVKPLRRAALEPAMKIVVEAIQYGEVIFNEDGSIIQNLSMPIPNVSKLEYKAHVAASVINAKLKALGNYSPAQKLAVNIQCYTGLAAQVVDMLEPADRDVADCLALFFG